MSKFPDSGPLSMATIAEGLDVPTNVPYSMNDFRGKTLYNTDNSTYQVPLLPTPLSIQYFYGRYYTPFPIYILINNDNASTIIDYPTLGKYRYLDYIIVGGGGGGGSGSIGNRYNGGGGGGSGYLKSSMTYTDTSETFSGETSFPPFFTVTYNYYYEYTNTTITDIGGTLTIPSNTSTITINIGSGGANGSGGGDGGDGGTTSILFDSTLKVSVFGGKGGIGGKDSDQSDRGNGANGYNGGGGAIGGRAGTGGTGDITNGGKNGQNAPNNDQPGRGGGGVPENDDINRRGGGWDPNAPGNFNEANENAGGGGGAGSAVKLYGFNFNPPFFPDDYLNTGGGGAGAYLSATNILSKSGTSYTGGGGGGGANRVVGAGQFSASPGGKGYAILYFH